MHSVLLSLLLLVAPTTTDLTSPTKPNIVIILADDLGRGDLRAYNAESKIPTPALDRLAREGVRLTDAHSPSAVCTPTRYGLLTGRYAWRTSLKSWVLGGYSPLLIDPVRPTIASKLNSAGYTTGVVGKWHLGLGDRPKTNYNEPLRPGPLQLGFDECFLCPASLDMPPYTWVINESTLVPPTDTIPNSKHRRQGGGGMWRGGAADPGYDHGQTLPIITRRAVSFLERAGQGDAPCFLYLPLTAPHTPWMPTDRWRGTTLVDDYGDFVAQVDGSVGEVLAAIDTHLDRDNTVVIFTSDNGSHWPPSDIEKFDHKANGDLRGMKADIHEGGHRVPFLARWPGVIPADSVSDELTCLTDLFATCNAIAGLPLDRSGEDSWNVLPALRGAPLLKPIREDVIHHSGDGMFAIRMENWKLIEGLGSGGFTKPKRVAAGPDSPDGQLYDLAVDPAETTNLWEHRPEVVERLLGRLRKVRGD